MKKYKKVDYKGLFEKSQNILYEVVIQAIQDCGGRESKERASIEYLNRVLRSWKDLERASIEQ